MKKWQTLNVIIKRADLCSVMFEESECIVITEVFKLDKSVLTIPRRNLKTREC